MDTYRSYTWCLGLMQLPSQEAARHYELSIIVRLDKCEALTWQFFPWVILPHREYSAGLAFEIRPQGVFSWLGLRDPG